MQRFPEKRIAITGAASGLGLALAKYYLAQGWRVALGDIQVTEGKRVLKSLGVPSDQTFFQKVDVTKAEDLRAWRELIETKFGGLDILVNNAGVATQGAMEDAPLEDWEWVLNINLLGVVRGCREFIPLFRQQRSGYIVNIASMAGLLHSPEMGSYNAAKAGVVAVSETLYGELVDSGVDVSVVCPGFFKTALAETARTTHPQVKQAIEKLFETSKLSADDVAERIFQGVEGKHFYILPHFNYRILWWLKRYLPPVYLRSMKTVGKQVLKRRKGWERALAEQADHHTNVKSA